MVVVTPKRSRAISVTTDPSLLDIEFIQPKSILIPTILHIFFGIAVPRVGCLVVVDLLKIEDRAWLILID